MLLRLVILVLLNLCSKRILVVKARQIKMIDCKKCFENAQKLRQAIKPPAKRQNFIQNQQVAEETFDIKFQGQSGYTILAQENKVKLRAEKIISNYNGKSGSIKIELCAVPVQIQKSNDWYKKAFGFVIG
ncbi:UNKNOWN [Stylonychia lemnae]|uniref:HMA domain-containing protein n=1 Tax=Stylonychia lemnae TaxID=5949 RepID=A0A078B925_STYLE|nr:UNKNOWN [Stylonychia lemnae]|eukprot:CDW90741.1 UNKNOWN [Stylonychia lemnae]